MATYYKWRKSTIAYSEKQTEETEVQITLPAGQTGMYLIYDGKPSITSDGRYDFSDSYEREMVDGTYVVISYNDYVAENNSPETMYTPAVDGDQLRIGRNGQLFTLIPYKSSEEYFYKYTVSPGPGTLQSYVYSTSSSAYPNGGVSGGYYYDQRTTVTSPTAPTGLTRAIRTGQ